MISEDALMSRITRRLIPFIFVLYIVSYLDRVNVSFAALQMNAALKFGPEVYSLGAGIFFIGYFLLEVPSNLILHRVGARAWMARILVTWGIISSCMMFVTGQRSFFALRFLLGAAEAGFFPGMILYLTYWFPLEARGRAVARFMTATAIAGAIGGPVSGALLRLNGVGGLAGWQWLFLIEGIPAVILGFVTFFYLPNGPADAKWLSTEEKSWLSDRLEKDREAARTTGHHSIREALSSGRVWTFAAIYFGIVMSFYGVTFWLPQIVQSISQAGDVAVGLITAAPWLAATIGMVLISRSSDRRGERRWHLALSAFTGGAGLLVAGTVKSPVGELAGLAIAAVGIWGTLGPFWAMASEFLAGSGAAAGIALINSVGNLGGFLGPYLVGWVRESTSSFSGGLMALAIFPAVAALIALSVKRPRPIS